jgi:hypothetical protein
MKRAPKRKLIILAVWLCFSFAVTSSLSAAENLLQNPSFEDSGWRPDYWSEWSGSAYRLPWNGAAGYLTPHQLHIGGKSAARKLYGADIRWGGYSQDVDIVGGSLVKASGWMLSLASDDPLANSTEAYIELKFFDADYEELAVYKSTSLTGASPWVQHTIIETAPSGAAKARFSFVMLALGDDSTGTVYFDDAAIMVDEGDVTPPSVTITSPENLSKTNISPITVTGTIDDPTVGLIYIDGRAEPVVGGAWSGPASLNEGENIIRATAIDNAGNGGTDTVTVYLDTTPPAITIDSPEDKSATGISPITVTGTVDDAFVAAIEVNGSVVPVTGGSWSTSVSLVEGSNLITATAVDEGGNVGSESVTVSLDTIPPEVTITSPENGVVTDMSSIEVKGRIDDLRVKTIEVNGNIEQVFNRYWSSVISLAEGENVITAIAADKVGNTDSDSITVYYNTPTSGYNILANPGFELSNWPPASWTWWEGSANRKSRDGVAGYLTPHYSHTGGKSVGRKLYGRGIRWGGYSQDVGITEGSFVNASGWIASPPSEEPLANGAEAYFELKFFDVRSRELAVYKSTPLTGPSSWVLHRISEVTPPGTVKARFSFVLLATTDGAEGTAYFDDASIRIGGADTTSPVVTITSPEDQSITNIAIVTVLGTVDDLTVAEIDVNGKVEPVISGSWSSSLALTGGENIITATAVDEGIQAQIR